MKVKTVIALEVRDAYVSAAARVREAVKKSTAVILIPQSREKDLRSCFFFNELRTTAGMLLPRLRDQHDRFEFFHSFRGAGSDFSKGEICTFNA